MARITTAARLTERMANEHQLVYDQRWARQALAKALEQVQQYATEEHTKVQAGRTVYTTLASNLATYAADAGALAGQVAVYDKAVAQLVNVAYAEAHEALEREASDPDANHATYRVTREDNGTWYTAYDLGGLELATTRYGYGELANVVHAAGYQLLGGPQL